ncbi:4Fe-4S cluster-binding domain-containing protein [Clostridium botulinum]|uniref:4Fe-4S cluster-binding domain-containing protein n=1 Tax=Clostridium botulinum TaxID=1491 RepID=UPI0004D3D1BB|nr:4Fe-4S cluster-binding domain-containing protein [Clostridium botulinum]KEH99774.1 anaerobic ribonucleoside triphosphate reductase activating protein [Clostridium botulinum C/D str. BKT75002]KEI05252.1 anaerobic ribonucleoside triphosphate reductase activating protein [Clostridium botulinum C/D str. BKT2873]QPW62140.1 4Fe-4S cluster-binding domain-containing protein [Clostridium botulinum]
MIDENIYVIVQSSINGDGLYYPAISIYFSGCDKLHKCLNCHNPEMQKQHYGFKTNTQDLIKDIEQIVTSWLRMYPTIAICYVGGESLAEWNRNATLNISKYFKTKYDMKIQNIVYSWRYLEDLQVVKKYIKYMDLGVLGEFRQELFQENHVPASSNQYIYDFKNNKKIKDIIKEDK